ncbi:MAG: hypothetical protein R2780_15385 [Crocinitomicaceae bacterium]|nr:hypothetical protein [Crocinitomicaceae bacterium]
MIILIILISLVSCKKELNGALEMKLGETLSNDDISLKVSAISDSRCPTDVDCFAAGWYEITFNATKQDSVVNFVLGSDNGLSLDSIVFNYKIEVTDLTPYPTGNDDSKDQRVHLKVSKQ